MIDAAELIKRMGEITLGHTKNVLRVTEGLCNGGVAIATDKDGNQEIFTPTNRETSFQSLEMLKKVAEENGLKCTVVHSASNEKFAEEGQQRADNHKQQSNDNNDDVIGLDDDEDDGKYKSITTGETPSEYDEYGDPI